MLDHDTGTEQPLERPLTPDSLGFASQRLIHMLLAGKLGEQACLLFLWLLALIASLLLQEKMVSYPKLDFSVQELQERFQQQLEMELNNTITIESVESTKPLTPQAIKAVKLGVWGLHVWREGGQFNPQDQWERGRDRGPKKEGSSLVTQSHHSITVLLPFLCSANC